MTAILLMGSGGREHALALALARSPRVDRVYVAPGNGGTAHASGAIGAKITNVAIPVTDLDALFAFAREESVDLTFVGPEAPLAAGCVDRWQDAGMAIFGPTQRAAQLETSKAFSKAFMKRWDIPTAASAEFTDFEAARAYLDSHWGPLVIKASGLAAGKGVLLPETLEEAHAGLRNIMVDGAFGDAGHEVVIEERLVGEEVSLLAFCDGVTAKVMPSARDHKRVFEGDLGPNTGGMGAYAPSPALDAATSAAFETSVLQRTVEGMAAEGNPYQGILYAGLMLTPDGPRVLEFNCRFGDPETQVILPLLQTDLLNIVESCLAQRLSTDEIEWHPGAAATVVMASGGYPGPYRKGETITGVDDADALDDVVVYHAGTRQTDDGLVTNGGRVLAVTGVGGDLTGALSRAYAGAALIDFEGAHLRRDVGQHLR